MTACKSLYQRGLHDFGSSPDLPFRTVAGLPVSPIELNVVFMHY